MTDNETCYGHAHGEDTFSFTAAERWSIGMIKRLKEKYPDDVVITYTNDDGSMVGTMPVSWMRIIPKKKMPDGFKPAHNIGSSECRDTFEIYIDDL